MSTKNLRAKIGKHPLKATEATTVTLYIKLYNSRGKLSTGTNSPSGYSFSQKVNIKQGENMHVLNGWGGENKGHWASGSCISRSIPSHKPAASLLTFVDRLFESGACPATLCLFCNEKSLRTSRGTEHPQPTGFWRGALPARLAIHSADEAFTRSRAEHCRPLGRSKSPAISVRTEHFQPLS